MSVSIKLRLGAVGASALLLSVALVGCAPSLPAASPSEPASAAPTELSESVESDQDESSDSTDSAPGTASVLQPGQSTDGVGELEFVNYDDLAAVFAHQVVAIEKAPQADVDFFTKEVPTVAGMDIAYIRIESSYVSGANLEFNSFYSNFRPIDANGNRVQTISTIGFENCDTNSIPTPGNDPATVIKNCFVTAWPSGGEAPVGVQWSPYDTPYDEYDGKPAKLLFK